MSISVSDDLVRSPEVSTTLGRRRIGLKHLTAITISIGVVGSVAMVAALLLGLWLVVRMRQKRRKLRDIASHSAKSEDVVLSTFITPPSKKRPYMDQHLLPRTPSQPDLRRLDVELASAGRAQVPGQQTGSTKQSEQSPSVRFKSSIRSPSIPTSRQGIILDRNRDLPPGNSTTRAPSRKPSRQGMIPDGTTPSEISTQIPSRSPRQTKTSEQNTGIPTTPIPTITQRVEPTLGKLVPKPSVRRLPPIPRAPQTPKRPPSPATVRPVPQPQPESIIPRRRGSSLPSSRPKITINVPAPAHHITSTPDDSVRPGSRFSVSPISRSFPSRLPFTGSSPPGSKIKSSSTTPTLLSQANRFGALPNLVPLKSDNL
ncbi:hypothetical protein C8R45DRAFT_409070 [Mycena sanguinolenta]|nr:hypothetical protein C8R45DRAFT_409070 [Mycena sanguinolenta]